MLQSSHHWEFSICNWTECEVISSGLPFPRKVGTDDLWSPLLSWAIWSHKLAMILATRDQCRAHHAGSFCRRLSLQYNKTSTFLLLKSKSTFFLKHYSIVEVILELCSWYCSTPEHVSPTSSFHLEVLKLK